MNNTDIILVTNSPGELFSWAKVTAEKLKAHGASRIIVALVPCPFASGKEVEIARNFLEIDQVITPWEFVKLSLGLPLKNYRSAKKGIVVFLGGDYWHAHILAKRLKFPVIAYAVKNSMFLNKFDRIAVIDQEMKDLLLNKDFPKEKISVIGNLMVDGIKINYPPEALREELEIPLDAPILGILPGSRLYHMEVSLPVFLKVAELVRQQLPEAKFIMGLSPFISIKELENCLNRPPQKELNGTTAILRKDEKGWKITTENNCELILREHIQYDLMNVSDVVLTIPGTNTAELAFLNKPMVVASTWKAKIPRGGIMGLLSNLPMGNLLKKHIITGILKKIKYTSLPNQLAQKVIVPEITVDRGGEDIAPVILDLLRNPEKRQEISRNLQGLFVKNDASGKISQLILDCLRENYG